MIKRSLRKSIKPLIGSMFMAIVLWFMVTTSKEYTEHVEVPLEIARLARGKTLLEKVPDKVNLELKGSGQSLIALSFYKTKFRLELPNIKESQQILLSEYINFLDIPSKLGLSVTKIIDPTRLNLVIDDMKITRKPVIFGGEIIPEPGYIALDTLFNQDSVTISGPKSIIDSLVYIPTENVKFEKHKYSFERSISLIQTHADILSINPREITIGFEIQRLVERVVYKIPITLKNIPSNFLVEAIPPMVSLRVKGGEKLVEVLKPEEIVAEFDFSTHYKPTKQDYAVSIKTPDDISWLECSPKTFNLHVKRK